MDSDAEVLEGAALISQKVITLFASRVSNIISVKREGAIVKKIRRTMSFVVSGKAITKRYVEARMIQQLVEQGPSHTSIRKSFLARPPLLMERKSAKNVCKHKFAI